MEVDVDLMAEQGTDNEREAREEAEARAYEVAMYSEIGDGAELQVIKEEGDDLTPMEAKVYQYKADRANLLVARSKNPNTVQFELQQIVTLAIPAKLCRIGEASRLPCQIFYEEKGARYGLICQWTTERQLSSRRPE